LIPLRQYLHSLLTPLLYVDNYKIRKPQASQASISPAKIGQIVDRILAGKNPNFEQG